ncbi:hypothetical protein GCM10010389_24710 [Streptomyces echinoruber]|uniref:Uncharacterized protein n=1 Tax=Streptomyces echinoruber TaxID=68898 RepID=A0A918VBF6_9ACTN|nr:hypothetical protein GCM10010389_24710 [Streptomyces echinoruber]
MHMHAQMHVHEGWSLGYSSPEDPTHPFNVGRVLRRKRSRRTRPPGAAERVGEGAGSLLRSLPAGLAGGPQQFGGFQ